MEQWIAKSLLFGASIFGIIILFRIIIAIFKRNQK